ncbi:MAG: hypothetical protein QOJ65_2251 [Fimbriimonadaceae bacterium]|jgi:TolB protein|nr:hypothetical protein [Fimbriimonadaceae bacterium]
MVLFAVAASIVLQTQPGTIAYIHGENEIRLIQPDGAGDRKIWTHPDLRPGLGLYNVAWSPDGSQLAFSSSHRATTSLFHADLFVIGPDGTKLRKVTNPPDNSEFGKFPKGVVSLTVRNDQPAFQQTHASAGIFLVYVAGAAAPQSITLPPGSSKTLLFKDVADFGNKAQAVVAMWGKYRWFMPGLDVLAGKTAKAPAFSISGDGIDMFGAFRPVWRRDGAELSYRTGLCSVERVPLNAPAGEFTYKPMFSGTPPMGACTWDWGPTAALADTILYTENASPPSSIYRMKEGGKHPGEKLLPYSDIEYQLLDDLRWLPDGSGFLYSTPTLMRDSENVVRYDFKTGKTSPVTSLENEFARRFAVSPDGQWIAYERAKSLDDDAETDLWISRLDGTDNHLLVRNGHSPSWSPK